MGCHSKKSTAENQICLFWMGPTCRYHSRTEIWFSFCKRNTKKFILSWCNQSLQYIAHLWHVQDKASLQVVALGTTEQYWTSASLLNLAYKRLMRPWKHIKFEKNLNNEWMNSLTKMSSSQKVMLYPVSPKCCTFTNHRITANLASMQRVLTIPTPTPPPSHHPSYTLTNQH